MAQYGCNKKESVPGVGTNLDTFGAGQTSPVINDPDCR